jgi:hypothetical protein
VAAAPPEYECWSEDDSRATNGLVTTNQWTARGSTSTSELCGGITTGPGVAGGEPERQPGAVAWFNLLGGVTATFLVAVPREGGLP